MGLCGNFTISFIKRQCSVIFLICNLNRTKCRCERYLISPFSITVESHTKFIRIKDIIISTEALQHKKNYLFSKKCIGDSMEKRHTDVVMYKQWICVDEHGNRPETAPHLNK